MRMSRAVVATALLMFAAGMLPFVWKVFVLDLPTAPSRESNVWRVELEVAYLGGDAPGSITLRLPDSDAAQLILDEQVDRDGLDFEIRQADAERFAVFRGDLQGSGRVSYTFRVHLRQDRQDITLEQPPGLPRSVEPSLERQLERLRVTPGDDPDSTIGILHSFVVYEVETARRSSDSDLLTLATREGSPLGKARLLTSLLRAAGLPAQTVLALAPRAQIDNRVVPLVEVQRKDRWSSLDPTSLETGRSIGSRILLARGTAPLVDVVGATDWTLTHHVLHEPLDAEEMVSFMTPPSAFWRAVSLYRLPIGAQEPLRVMLVLPLAALIAAAFRNLVGLRTFGTFMPVLIALSLREIDLASGLMLVVAVLVAGTTWRLFLDRLRLLFVPRVCLLLSLVVLMVSGLTLAGHAFDLGGTVTGLLLPIVILAMLIERIAVTTIEEGPLQAGKLLLGSLGIAIVAYPVFRSATISHLFFGFPELVLCIMGGLVLIGGYTGYRLTELHRFRSIAAPLEAS